VGHLLLLRNGIAPMDDRDDLMSIHESLGVILVDTMRAIEYWRYIAHGVLLPLYFDHVTSRRAPSHAHKMMW
jgi:hypothetical protein